MVDAQAHAHQVGAAGELHFLALAGEEGPGWRVALAVRGAPPGGAQAEEPHAAQRPARRHHRH
jgi:hypothetical protein